MRSIQRAGPDVVLSRGVGAGGAMLGGVGTGLQRWIWRRSVWYANPTFYGVPKPNRQKLKVAASPLPSQGPEKRRKCYTVPAFSVVSYKKNKIRIGCLTHRGRDGK